MVDFVHMSDTHLQLRDLRWDEQWHFDYLATPLLESVHLFLNSQRLPSWANCDLLWVWSALEVGVYSAASGYKWLTKRHQDLGMEES